jgi:hypothetical protein
MERLSAPHEPEEGSELLIDWPASRPLKSAALSSLLADMPTLTRADRKLAGDLGPVAGVNCVLTCQNLSPASVPDLAIPQAT